MITRVGSMVRSVIAAANVLVSSGAAAASRITRVFMDVYLVNKSMERSCQLESDILGAFPESLEAKFTQALASLGDSQKVIAGQLTHLAGKAAGAVGHDDFGFAVAAGVEKNVAN